MSEQLSDKKGTRIFEVYKRIMVTKKGIRMLMHTPYQPTKKQKTEEHYIQTYHERDSD